MKRLPNGFATIERNPCYPSRFTGACFPWIVTIDGRVTYCDSRQSAREVLAAWKANHQEREREREREREDKPVICIIDAFAGADIDTIREALWLAEYTLRHAAHVTNDRAIAWALEAADTLPRIIDTRAAML